MAKLTAQQKADIEACYAAAEKCHQGLRGCCVALEELDPPRRDLIVRMQKVWLNCFNNPEQRTGWWMQEWNEHQSLMGPELQSRRVLALCFFAELIRTGDA